MTVLGAGFANQTTVKAEGVQSQSDSKQNTWEKMYQELSDAHALLEKTIEDISLENEKLESENKENLEKLSKENQEKLEKLELDYLKKLDHEHKEHQKEQQQQE